MTKTTLVTVALSEFEVDLLLKVHIKRATAIRQILHWYAHNEFGVDPKMLIKPPKPKKPALTRFKAFVGDRMVGASGDIDRALEQARTIFNEQGQVDLYQFDYFSDGTDAKQLIRTEPALEKAAS